MVAPRWRTLLQLRWWDRPTAYWLAAVLVLSAILDIAHSPLLPYLGDAHPLDIATQGVVWALIAAGILAGGFFIRRDPIAWLFEDAPAPNIAAVLISGFLVLISILGVAELNHTGNARLAIVGTVLDGVVLLAGIVGGWRRDSQWPLSTLLYGASLALMLSTSLRGSHLYGWDIQQEFGVALNTAQAGVWRIPANHDPYASMLSLTVLPVILQSLVKLRLLAFFQLVVPAILSLLPVAIFASVRSTPRWITSGRNAPRPGLAFAVVVGIIVSSVAFSQDLVSITRQAMATTMLGALLMVMLDRSMSKRSSQVIIALLIIEVSFTHYTTSYLLAAVLGGAWLVCLVWERGTFLVAKFEIVGHRERFRTRRILNLALVVVALAAAFGWNNAITRNYALSNPSGAVAAKGVGIGSSTVSAERTPTEVEHLLIGEFSRNAKYLVRIPKSERVTLVPTSVTPTKGVAPSIATPWNKVDEAATEGLWLILGLALLYGIFRLGRRRAYAFSSDLVGLGVTGLLLGGLLRSSGTLSSFYNPERAAIITSMLLAAPATIFLDDLLSRRRTAAIKETWVTRTCFGAIVAYVAVLIVGATGIGTLVVGGQAPGSLAKGGLNVDEFTVSTPELATAQWLRRTVKNPSIVQSDLHGQLVLLSQPGSYDLISEIVPPEVDHQAYVYLSQFNLAGNTTQVSADNNTYEATYRTTLQFFNQHFYVVYSTGGTRVYH
jgi:uncharacterized membrane protein